MPASASLTTSSGLLINFFMISLLLVTCPPDIPQGNLCLGDSNHYNDDGGCISIAIGAFLTAICSSITLREGSTRDCCCSADQSCSFAMRVATSSTMPRPRLRASKVIEVRRAHTSYGVIGLSSRH